MAKTAVQEKPETLEMVIAPWGIEADHPRNCDLLIQCIPGVRLRSAIDGTKSIRDQKTGDIKIPLDQARQLASFPRTPGMQLHVVPHELRYVIFDPLTEEPVLLERITKWLRDSQPTNSNTKIRGVATVKGTLDIHRMKSLCREMRNIVLAEEAKIVKGEVPSEKELDELPGHFLLNPGSRVGNTQPVYEHEWDEWVSRLSRSGG